MKHPFSIHICENYRLEIESALMAIEWKDIIIHTFPPKCDHPGDSWLQTLQKKITSSPDYPCAVIGGDCVRLLEKCHLENKSQTDHQINFVSFSSCLYLVTNKSLVDHWIHEGSYLITSGWLNRWREQIDTCGFNKQTAQRFFHEFAKELLLLDTGVSSQSDKLIREMAEFLNLPFRILPVGLDHFQMILKNIYYQQTLEQERNLTASEQAESNKKLADYSMMVNLFGVISAIRSEEEVSSAIIELFSIICAPSRIFYLPIMNHLPLEPKHFGFHPSDIPFEIQKMMAISDQDSLSETETGFCIPIKHLNETVGILKLEGFAFPEYKMHYLNIADTIGKVSGLAVDNARKYTELKIAKEELSLAKDAADSANRAKSEFLSNMSHELRTPLNGILGYAQILRRDTSLTDAQRAGINIIERCGNHLLHLINEILDLSKIEARKLELYFSEFQLMGFLTDVVKMIQIRAQQKCIGFRTEFEDALPHTVCGDEKRLSQVLLNLLSNAVKFTDHGEVVFRVKRLPPDRSGINAAETVYPPISSCSSSLLHHRIRFEVEDTGVGIELNQLEEIFSPFKQVGKHARTTEGTGLGLTISRKLVRLMKGNLHVQSTIGKGSIFSFEIDLPETSMQSEAKPEEDYYIVGYRSLKPEDKSRFTILVADDRWENRMVLANMLTPLGFHIIEAANGIEALQKSNCMKPDLILLDLVMPEMDGFEAARQIRSSKELASIKLVAVSASTSQSFDEIVINHKLDGFLVKPVKFSELFKELKKQLPLEWIQRKSSQTESELVQNDSVILPSQSDIQTLYKYAKGGDITGLLRLMSFIETSDPRYSPFVNQIRTLAKSFKMKQLREVISSYIHEKDHSVC